MSLQSQRLPSEAVPGPMEGTRITEAYARMVARDAYFWAWPMVNMFNKRLAFSHAPEPGLLGGILPFAPLNRLSMLSDYVEPTERNVACPNQDVVYGAGLLALDVSPVVVQVPDFANRFWVYQAVDLRTDSFADSARCTAPSLASICWWGRNGGARCPQGSPRCSAPRRAPALSALASSRTTHSRTGRRCSR